MKISNQAVVSIHYTLKNGEGEVLDTSEGRDPLNYLHGANNIVPGLENALVDKSAGDELQVVVAPTEGYGEYDEGLVQSVPMAAFEGVQVEVGANFQAQTEGGPLNIVIKAIEGDTVVVDSNHPLAGEDLHFEVSIADVREATEEEIAHGHVH